MSVNKVKLSDGEIRWEVRIHTHGRLGKKLRRRFERKNDAQEFLQNYLQRKEEIEVIPESPSTIHDLAEIKLNQEIDFWLEMKGEGFSEGYWRVINPGLKVIRALYGNFELSRITPGLLLNFRKLLKDKDNNVSVSTQNRYCELICRIVNFSFIQGRITKNQLLSYKSQKESREGVSFWNEREVKTFLSFADKKFPPESDKRWIFVVYLFLLETGVRARELWGLQIRDVKIDSHAFQISRQLARSGKYTSTKGGDERLVPMSKTLNNELVHLIAHRKEKDKGSPLFKSTTGTPIDHDNFVPRTFRIDLKESGLRKIRFHDLRHTAITQMVKRNISPWIIQRIAGHSDLKTTLKYVHIVGKDIEKIGKEGSIYLD